MFAESPQPVPGPRHALVRGAAAAGEELTVALVIPLSGPAGVFGPSCELSARLAVGELNEAGGVLGRRVRLLPVDGGRAPDQVAAEVAALVDLGAVDAVVGWHISAVRRALVPRIAGRVPYVYTAQYEGGERAPGVFVTGETPARQLLPAMRLLADSHGVRRWFVVGNDYVWPRVTARAALRYARACGGRVCGQEFVALGTEDYAGVMRAIDRSGADVVLMLLIGADAVHFSRAYAACGLHQRALRLSTHMDENMLMAAGAEAMENLWAAAGYFETLATAESLAFSGRYAARFGTQAPVLSSLGESCYEGVRLLAALADRARSLDVRALMRAGRAVAYEGPRGAVSLHGNHVDQPIYLARADGPDFDIVAQL
ncbi:substrate-binding domain-containing protein [Actinospica sp. MGRD01-02]|uniref:Substrate-binding domain-containing protein n=1 Tax=Actinospica acidithermotolerans TaxID=2828514 RepID=A0A941EGM6_9ACTN|nr:substrate-binding domain-containing protein [Actinospica acidithermotolerans]MBR7831122.1 substrate-binding domain-containing protein [Actinospica acidithermotolerans]